MSQLSTGHSREEKHTALAVAPASAGHMLGLSLSEIYERLRCGELQSYRDGRARRITMASIHDYVARRLAASADGWTQIVPQPQPQPSRRREKRVCGGAAEATKAPDTNP